MPESNLIINYSKQQKNKECLNNNVKYVNVNSHCQLRTIINLITNYKFIKSVNHVL